MTTTDRTNVLDEPDYFGVFNLFANAMCHDYVDCAAARTQVRHQGYIEDFGQKMWNGQGYTIQFAQYLSAYLLAFRTAGLRLIIDHAQTPYYPAYTWGMRVRACDDALWVTDALPDCPFAAGEAIVNASVYAEPVFPDVAALRHRFGASLYGSTPEREVWDPMLHFVNRYLVRTDGIGDLVPDGSAAVPAVGLDAHGMRLADATRTRRVEPTRLPLPAAPAPFELVALTGDALGDAPAGTLLLTLRDLADEDGFAAFVERNRGVLDRAPALVVDARRCSGGTEGALLPLMPYVVDSPTAPDAFMEPTCLTNYTVKNVARQTESIERVARQVTDPDVLAQVDAWKSELAEKSGAGLLEEPCDIPDECRAEAAPRGDAEKVCLLTDVGTCDAADALAEVCLASPRAATVGRATRGSRGYFNPAVVSKECFALEYPISRYTDEGLARHYARIGVPPQTHIPWTPAFCHYDPDLEAATGLLCRR